jgi:large subunit ribosomal protein L28
MSKSCIVTGKKTSFGNNVSHAKNKTRRKIYANLQKKHLLNPATGRKVTVTISNRGMRTLKKWDREGKAYNLTNLKKDGTLAVK